MTPTDPTEVRLALLNGDYDPIPLGGKHPILSEWQKIGHATPEQATNWLRDFEDATNTGVLCRRTPFLDIDIRNSEAADDAEALIAERFDGHYLLKRFGQPPKRAIPFQTAQPFKKIKVVLIPPNAEALPPEYREQGIEFLCDGQQCVVDGIHPETQKRYSWHGGTLFDVSRDALPGINDKTAQQLVADIADLLVREHGYRRKNVEPKKSPAGNGGADWDRFLDNLIDHDKLIEYAMSLLRAGLSDGAAVNLLRAQVERLRDVDADRKQRRLDEIPGMVSSARAKLDIPEPRPDEPLPYVDLSLGLKPREWLVPERIPMRNVTLLSGEGAIGKSLLLMQLSGATALSGDWIGARPAQGPVLYVSCEEDDDEIRRRMEDVARHLGAAREEMIERSLRVLSFAGKDAILAQPDRTGIIKPTPLFDRLRRDTLQQRPRLIVLDTVADTFGGKENDRAQTRQFITMLRGLAIDADSTVVLAAHPSLAGIATDTGLSGNTGWHNGPRARMYFKPAPGDDTSLRVLEVKKNNYGPESENILLRWDAGVYVVAPGGGTFEQLMAEAETENLFMTLLRRVTKQGRNVSDKPSPSYAPTVFAGEPEARKAKTTKETLAEAMARLFANGKIRVVPFGPASRMRTRIVELGNAAAEPATILPFPSPPSNDPSNPLPTPSNAVSEGDSNDPSNALPTPFQRLPTGCAPAPPIPPSPVGRGKGALEEPAPSNGGVQRPSNWRGGAAPGGEEPGDVLCLSRVLREWEAAYGIDRTVTIDELVAADHSGLKDALLAVAAMDDGRTVSNVRLVRWLRNFNEVSVDRMSLQHEGINSKGSQMWKLRAGDPAPAGS